MNTAISFAIGAGYFAALAALAVFTSALKPWFRYILGILAFLVAFFVGLDWAVEGEDGPSGFAVVAAHGLIFWVFIIANATKWIRTLISFIKRTRTSNPP